jgi:Lipid A 3-O-deacylase (PagL)
MSTFCVFLSVSGYGQDMVGAEPSLGGKPTKPPVESEIIFEGLASYGNYRIFASGTDFKLYTVGAEYDRHSWGYFLWARMDYVAEVLPLVLLRGPTKTDIWGNPQSYDRHTTPGVGFSPIGFRLLWRPNKAVQPYLTFKGGMLFFTEKAISDKATYENFSLQDGFGLQIKMNHKLALRLGLFSDFHFSNAFIVPVNPGLDVMNANLGLSYQLGK